MLSRERKANILLLISLGQFGDRWVGQCVPKNRRILHTIHQSPVLLPDHICVLSGGTELKTH